MPRYFFNTRIDDSYVPDPEGVELRDPDQAWTVARVTITELLREEGQTPRLLNAVLEVTGEDGEIVLEFPFSEVLMDMPGMSLSKH
ncbi:MAG: hypothetical protein J0I29_08915 [Rhizobiales bacterium]|nr:hypothetical protein [Hyphomicrobiales bacterium]